MIDSYMNPATFPWDTMRDALIRQPRVVDQMRAYPLAEMNQDYLIELGMIYGHEGADYQNPHVWAGRGVLAYPNEHTPGLVPSYGVGAGQSYPDIAMNIRTTAHLAVIDERPNLIGGGN